MDIKLLLNRSLTKPPCIYHSKTVVSVKWELLESLGSIA